ncbi:hypothetical protein CDD80_3854 [Ophiocordyceps camponoti-rufipedis]|uniref:Uncharacterized protein n=1 Tax=Ophiocordyceps camponoti-rufipedis TaxID=2004952 RepID=A0A2C5Z2F6_9HYPO|nr:hypothetical protein CDD80_3854 [Ophiocordyceps camponoti-rufipedis]
MLSKLAFSLAGLALVSARSMPISRQAVRYSQSQPISDELPLELVNKKTPLKQKTVESLAEDSQSTTDLIKAFIRAYLPSMSIERLNHTAAILEDVFQDIIMGPETTCLSCIIRNKCEMVGFHDPPGSYRKATSQFQTRCSQKNPKCSFKDIYKAVDKNEGFKAVDQSEGFKAVDKSEGFIHIEPLKLLDAKFPVVAEVVKSLESLGPTKRREHLPATLV